MATTADLNDLTAAIEIATTAGQATLEWFHSPDLDVDRKGDGTPVTIADRTAEQMIRDELGRRFPDDAIVGEEHDDAEGASGRTWIIDPIDGTKAFVRGVPLYSTLLAMWDGEGPAIGVVVFPALGEVIAAGRGLGCTWNGRTASATTTDTMQGALVTTSSYSAWPTSALETVVAGGALTRTWGDAYGYALVATGRADVMVDPELEWWDIAPMAVIIPESGGRLTQLDGGPIIAGFGSAVASGGGALHDTVLSLFPTPVEEIS